MPGNNPPKLLAPPQVHPLPYTSTPTPGVRTASRLLGLGSSYPPSQAVSGFKPIIDVSSTTGQVFLVLDPRRSSPSKRDSPGGGRRDWLIVLDFEVGVERCVERGSQQVSIASGNREPAFSSPACQLRLGLAWTAQMSRQRHSLPDPCSDFVLFCRSCIGRRWRHQHHRRAESPSCRAGNICPVAA